MRSSHRGGAADIINFVNNNKGRLMFGGVLEHSFQESNPPVNGGLGGTRNETYFSDSPANF